MKYIILFIIITIAHSTLAQVVKGKIETDKHEALLGATIVELGTVNGTTSDQNGKFELKLNSKNSQLIISYAGFKTDTVSADLSKEKHYQLKEDTELLEEVVVDGNSVFIDALDPKHAEIITESELTKAACCNLSESFETNASVDVSFSDAVTGAKTIKLLGLAGKYVQMNRENIPHIRGLTSRYGLGFIPGTWIQSIDVGKGAGSVVNGYESMTGQINLEFKKPENSEKLYLNGYTNSFGRMELNLNHARDINDKWSTAILFHGDNFNNDIDNNDDGFQDLPKSRQFNIMNRYKYQGEKVVTQIGIQAMFDEKAGGQNGFGFSDDVLTSSQYGFSNSTKRFEVYGKTGLLFPHKPYKGWGFIYSASYLDMSGGYGRNGYKGEETTLYGNVIFQNIISNTKHQYKTGVSLLYDDFNENFVDSLFSRRETVPGAYFEYTYLPNDKFTLVAGLRNDFHNLYGNYFTPRFHMRYQLSENTTVRGALGKGYRTPNAIIENSNVLVSSRQLIVQEAPDPEISWNMGGSLVTSTNLFEKPLSITADYFYTNFNNQLIYDLDQNPGEINIYNLDGSSYAHSFQYEMSYPITKFWKVKGAYKYYDVKATINGTLREVPFNPKHRFFINSSYATKYDKWQADVTVQWIGSKRLPSTLTRPIEFQRPERSPSYAMVNVQVARGVRWGSIYLGSENLFNFKQADPIIDAENPFGNDFDASFVWGPIAGRVVYAGLRYKIKR